MHSSTVNFYAISYCSKLLSRYVEFMNLIITTTSPKGGFVMQRFRLSMTLAYCVVISCKISRQHEQQLPPLVHDDMNRPVTTTYRHQSSRATNESSAARHRQLPLRLQRDLAHRCSNCFFLLTNSCVSLGELLAAVDSVC